MEPSHHLKNGANPKSHTSRKLNNLNMKKYLIKGTYNADGTKGLAQEGGTKRKQAVEKAMAAAGGKLESFYYAFGQDDVYIIAEMPDDISAIAVGLRVNSSGVVRISTTPLLTPEDIDEASKKSIDYRAPGQK
jgi:uncharacterized protein with GYD domain